MRKSTIIRSMKYTHILGGASRDFDPRFWEECARAKHEQDVEEGVDRVLYDVTDRFGRREVIAQSTNWVGPGGTTASDVGPNSEQIYYKITLELDGQHLRYDVQIRDQSWLKNDGNIAGVE